MKVIILILVILSFLQLNNCQEVSPNDAILFQTFTNWMDNYGVYYSTGEIQHRFLAWKDNLLKIAELNAANNVPDVLYKVEESTQETASMRTLLEAGPVVTESFPGQEVQKFELNQFSDLTATEFTSIYGGAEASLAFSAASGAVLSTGAIVGIAIGGGAALIAGTAATVFIVKKKRGNKKQKEQKQTQQEDVKMKPTNGIDLLNRTDDPHRSITARAFYT